MKDETKYSKSSFFGGTFKKKGIKEYLMMKEPVNTVEKDVFVPTMYYNKTRRGWMKCSTIMNKEEYDKTLKAFNKTCFKFSKNYE